MTVAAVCSLTASYFMLTSGSRRALLATHLLLSALIAVVAMALWVIYFRESARFKVQSHQENTMRQR